MQPKQYINKENYNDCVGKYCKRAPRPDKGNNKSWKLFTGPFKAFNRKRWAKVTRKEKTASKILLRYA